MTVRLVATFPHTYNHLFLEWLFMSAAASVRIDDADEARLFLGFARATIVIVLFWSGLQKLLHGCYAEGQFLAVSVAANPYFAAPFRWIAGAEVERLEALLPLIRGAGPFRFEPTWLVVGSNAVWILEMALPLALLWPALRRIAILGTLLLLACIESAARELVFGVLFGAGVLLFTAGRRFERLLPVLVACVAALLAVAILAPGFWMN